MTAPDDCRITKFEPVTDDPRVCARLVGTALTYNRTIHDTILLPGCVSALRPEIRLLVDHHINAGSVGVVRSVDDSGDEGVVTADVFNTDAGRDVRDAILRAIESGFVIGLDIGYTERASHWVGDVVGGKSVRYVTDLDLREVSIIMPPGL